MAKDLLGQSLDFISKNILDIMLVVLIIFLSISYMIVHGIKIKKNHPKLKKVVIFENFDNFNNVLKKGFCTNTDSKDLTEAEANCNKLGKEQCSDIDCCLFDIKHKKCVNATRGRPTNLESNIDEWYYLGKLKSKSKILLKN